MKRRLQGGSSQGFSPQKLEQTSAEPCGDDTRTRQVRPTICEQQREGLIQVSPPESVTLSSSFITKLFILEAKGNTSRLLAKAESHRIAAVDE